MREERRGEGRGGEGKGREEERRGEEERGEEKGKRTRRCWPSDRRDPGPARLRALQQKMSGLGSGLGNGLGHMWTRDESAAALARGQSGTEEMDEREQVGRPSVDEAFWSLFVLTGFCFVGKVWGR